MFSRRAEQGALKLGGPERTERGSRLGGPEQKLGSRARAGSAQAQRLEDAALSFYSTCAVPVLPSTVRTVNPHIAPSFSSIRSACT